MSRPKVLIISQPLINSSYRVRYEGELTKGRPVQTLRTKIKVENFVGRADIILSAVTADGENLPHPVKIVNNKDPESHSRGYSYFQTKIDSTGFVDLKFGIVGVAAKDVAHWLDIRSKHHVDPFNTGFKTDVKNLKSIRICIQVFVYKDGAPVKLDPVVTESLSLKKKEKLFIRYMVPSEGSVDGGTEVTILCNKIHKDDIIVEFLDEKSGWKTAAEISEPGVYKQMSVTFKSPPYFDAMLRTSQIVHVRLRRPSDDEVSNEVEFVIKPEENREKRKRDNWTSNLSTITQLLSQKKKAKFSDAQDFEQTTENCLNISSNNLLSEMHVKEFIADDCPQLDANLFNIYDYLFGQNSLVDQELIPDVQADPLPDLNKQVLL